MVKNTPNIASGQERCVRPSSGYTEIPGFRYRQGLVRKSYLFRIPAGSIGPIQEPAPYECRSATEHPRHGAHEGDFCPSSFCAQQESATVCMSNQRWSRSHAGGWGSRDADGNKGVPSQYRRKAGQSRVFCNPFVTRKEERARQITAKPLKELVPKRSFELRTY